MSPGSSKTLSLEVWVPYSSSGLCNLTVRATGWTTQERNVSIYVNKVDPQVLSSKYPIARATPGSTVTFDLTISNVLTKRFTSAVIVDCPTDWAATLTRGDGSGLYGLSLEPGSSLQAELELDVPVTASPGDYQVVVSVSTPDFESHLQLTVTVVTGEPKPRLRTELPYVDAYAGNAATYSITLANIGNLDGIISIALEGLPSGYAWTAKESGGSVVSKVYLRAGESKELSVVVTIPPLAEPDVKELTLKASAGDLVDQLNLRLGILGSYGLSYVTQNFYVESSAGRSGTFQVSVRNSGYSSLTNVKLQASDVPDGFEVSVDPGVVLLLTPQGTATFTVTFTTEATISAGDYYVTLSLAADQYQVSARSLHIYVKQSAEVVYVGAGIAVVVVAALLLVYRKYGRR
jgi:uncharacterized membrane protein